MLYNQALEKIIQNKKIKSEGGYLGIPYPYKRLNEFLCGIDKGQAIGILGPTGTGKSKFTRYTFLYSIYRFYKETGYKCRILFFCLEDSKDYVYSFVLCNYLKEVHGINISEKELNSRTRELPDFILDKIKEAKLYFEEFENIVSFIDGVTEPEKLYEICKGVAIELGGEPEPYYIELNGKQVKQWKYESDTHVIAIFDNMSNIDMDDDSSNEQQAILKFVKEYMRLKLCNFFKWSCVMVMQMDFESERQSFTRGGESIIAKLEPSLASIGDSKRSSRSFHLIFSLFNPSRHELIHYPQPNKHDPDNVYRIDILGDRFRSLRVIKSNNSATGMRVGLMFDALGEKFEELPQPKTPEIDTIYKSINSNYSKLSETIPTFEKPKEINGFKQIDDTDELPF